jgi:acyl dehydratase
VSVAGRPSGGNSPTAASRLVTGDLLPETVVTPERTDFVRFAGAGGDFNPIHHDEVYAQALGHPSVFAMGMWTASVASRTLTDFFGPGALRAFSVRFVGPVWPGQPLHFRTLVGARRDTPGEELLDVEITVESGGEMKLTGKAAVAIPMPGPASISVGPS